MSNQLPDFADINVRREIYKEAYKVHLEDLKYYSNNGYLLSGICYCISLAIIRLYPNYKTFTIKNNFPEFEALKPDESEMYGNYWWNRLDYEIRKQIFENHLINI